MSTENDKTTEPGWEVVSEKDLEQAAQATKVETEVVDKPKNDDQDVFGKRAEKRIRDLVKRAKAAEERAALAEGRVGKFEEDFSSLRAEIASIKQGNQTNTKEAIQARYVAARNSLRAAKENGDTMAEIAAIEAMTAAQADWRLAGVQPQQETKKQEREEVKTSQGDGLHPKAKRWIDSQEWWDTDDVARGAAIAIAARLEREGYEPTDDEHYEELNKRLAKRFPEHFEGEGEEREVKVRQQVAGGSRVAATGGGRQKVKLTEGQVKMAEKLGVPIEVYARNLARLDASKRADGTYGPVEIDVPVGGKWS